jgi:pimeloyl-ACP methyl ester carboxylesterase
MASPIDTFTHHTLLVNGIRMHYVRAGAGERLVLLLHGFPEFWYSWRYQIPVLSERFTVVAPDLRGYNETDKPGWGYELDVLASDVVGLIHELGYSRAIVAGHDWGGMIAWAAAIIYPHWIERLIVLNAPHPARFAEEIRRNPRQILRSWYILFFQLPLLPEALIRANDYTAIAQGLRSTAVRRDCFSDADIRAFKAAIARPGALTAALNYYRAAARQGLGWVPSGADLTVRVPTLIIWGEQDVALEKTLTYGTERFVPDLRVRYLPHCSHWVQQECPDEVNQAMLAFLADLRPGPPD